MRMMTRLAFVVAACTAPLGAWAQSWVDYATVSMTNATTPKLSANRLCYTDGTDVACDANSGGLLYTSSTVYATAFVGDGSGLTGVVASTADRIVSGTTSMIAYTSNGYISVTQASFNTAYFHPSLGLVTVGVSSTGRISTTDLGVRGVIDIVSGSGNVLVGKDAGLSNTGSSVVALGQDAARYNSGTHVVALGRGSSAYNSSSWGVSVGSYSAQFNSGTYVNALGYASAQFNQGEFVNVIGSNSAQHNSGTNVNAIGDVAAQYNTGSNVNAIGNIAAQYNTGSNVNAIGPNSARQNSGTNVNAIGNSAAQYNTGSNVNAIGNSAAQYNSSSNVDVFGYNAARYNTGSNVVAFGYNAAINNSYSNIAALGYNAQPTKANQVVLGDSNIVEVSTAGVLRAGGLSTSGTLKVSSTVYATAFVGDGSGLTGVVASTGDRIVSGTTSMIAYTSNGYISVTQASFNTAYFHPSLGLVTVGVSSTGGISGTTGYFGGNVGFGTTAPSARVHVSGTIVSMPSTNAGTTIDWSVSNVQSTSSSCGAFTFSNMLDGGTYTLTVEGTSAGTCSFTHSGLTFRMPSNHGATTGGTMTLYSFVRRGTNVFVTWNTGY